MEAEDLFSSSTDRDVTNAERIRESEEKIHWDSYGNQDDSTGKNQNQLAGSVEHYSSASFSKIPISLKKEKEMETYKHAMMKYFVSESNLFSNDELLRQT